METDALKLEYGVSYLPSAVSMCLESRFVHAASANSQILW